MMFYRIGAGALAVVLSATTPLLAQDDAKRNPRTGAEKTAGLKTSAVAAQDVSLASHATALLRAEIRNAENEEIGTIEDLIVDDRLTRIAFAVASFDDMDDRLVAIPLSALAFKDSDGDLTATFTHGDRNAWPSFGDDDWNAALTGDVLDRVQKTTWSDEDGREAYRSRPLYGKLNRVSELMDADVETSWSDDEGRIEEILVHPGTGVIRSVIVDTGGFLGFGGTLTALPADGLHVVDEDTVRCTQRPDHRMTYARDARRTTDADRETSNVSSRDGSTVVRDDAFANNRPADSGAWIVEVWSFYDLDPNSDDQVDPNPARLGLELKPGTTVSYRVSGAAANQAGIPDRQADYTIKVADVADDGSATLDICTELGGTWAWTGLHDRNPKAKGICDTTVRIAPDGSIRSIERNAETAATRGDMSIDRIDRSLLRDQLGFIIAPTIIDEPLAVGRTYQTESVSLAKRRTPARTGDANASDRDLERNAWNERNERNERIRIERDRSERGLDDPNVTGDSNTGNSGEARFDAERPRSGEAERIDGTERETWNDDPAERRIRRDADRRVKEEPIDSLEAGTFPKEEGMNRRATESTDRSSRREADRNVRWSDRDEDDVREERERTWRSRDDRDTGMRPPVRNGWSEDSSRWNDGPERFSGSTWSTRTARSVPGLPDFSMRYVGTTTRNGAQVAKFVVVRDDGFFHASGTALGEHDDRTGRHHAGTVVGHAYYDLSDGLLQELKVRPVSATEGSWHGRMYDDYVLNIVRK